MCPRISSVPHSPQRLLLPCQLPVFNFTLASLTTGSSSSMLKSLSISALHSFSIDLKSILNFALRQCRAKSVGQCGNSSRFLVYVLILASMASTVLVHISYIYSGQKILVININRMHLNLNFRGSCFCFFSSLSVFHCSIIPSNLGTPVVGRVLYH